MPTTSRTFIALLSLLALGACSKRPIIAPGADEQKQKAAVEECIKQGDEAKGDGRLQDIATRGAVGGAASAAAGGGAAAVGNAMGGNYSVGGSMGISAVAGVASNLVIGAADRDVDPAYAQFVERCLSKKGFRTLGWE